MAANGSQWRRRGQGRYYCATARCLARERPQVCAGTAEVASRVRLAGSRRKWVASKQALSACWPRTGRLYGKVAGCG